MKIKRITAKKSLDLVLSSSEVWVGRLLVVGRHRWGWSSNGWIVRLRVGVVATSGWNLASSSSASCCWKRIFSLHSFCSVGNLVFNGCYIQNRIIIIVGHISCKSRYLVRENAKLLPGLYHRIRIPNSVRNSSLPTLGGGCGR